MKRAARVFEGYEVGDATAIDEARRVVQPAGVYDAVDDLWIVTSYFDPVGYNSRRQNYHAFAAPIIAGGLHLLTIECAFGDDAFVLPPSPHVVRVRSQHIMWQKERLLNLAIGRLPTGCTKVAWVDCDTLFTNPSWAVATSQLLERFPVVQPYEKALRLPHGWTAGSDHADCVRGFAAKRAEDPEGMRSGNYARHGETGLAWAARRNVLEPDGLYDACIIGGGDHVMAHAMCGDWDSVCIDRLIGLDAPQAEHLRVWGERFAQRVQHTVGHVAGAAVHLWHGERSERRYSARHRELAAFGFDPQRDLRLAASGCWEWASDKPQMHAWAAAYFAERREDGVAERAAGPVARDAW